jgi:hypothetical protein
LFIGYSGYSADNQGIADRRRIIFWARERGHQIVGIDDNRADVKVITSSSDLEFWREHRSNVPVVLDVVDGLLAERSIVKDYSRAVASSSKRNFKKITSMRFSNLLTEVAGRVDSVICSSHEQRLEWIERGVYPHQILDFHEEIPEVNGPVLDFSKKINLFWEGLPVTLNSLSQLKGLFDSNQKRDIQLQLLTVRNSYHFRNKYFPISTFDLVAKQIKSQNVSFKVWDWSPENCGSVAKHSHLGVIPVSLTTGYHRLKAENRLLIMWRLGLNTLTSPLASYTRVMKAAEIDGVCLSKSDWSQKLKQIENSSNLREENREKATNYLRLNHSKEGLLRRWDSVFEKI